MRSRICAGVIVCAALIAFAAKAMGAEALSRADVARLAKPATVLVDARPARGTAFCVHASGLFISNAHVVQFVKDGGAVKLVLDAGEAAQRVVVGDRKSTRLNS